MIDIGVNLSHKQFNPDRAEVVAQAKASGLTNLILTGTTLENSQRSYSLAFNSQGFMFSTAGVHPHYAKDFTLATKEKLATLLHNPEVVAVGECGLDFDRNFSSKEEQFFAFEQQLELAAEIKKPLFLHEREAHNDFISVMKEHPTLIESSVVHCFTSNKDHLKRYLDMGFYIGITGWICDNKRGKDLQEAVKYIPLDRLMIETDAPFLTPKNLPGNVSRRNEPKHLPHIAKELSTILKMDEATFIQTVTNNTKNFFQI